MADPNLTESAWQRAKEDAAGVYPTTGFQIGGALVTLVVGSFAAVASAGGSTSIQIAIPVLGGAVALGMTFLAVLAFQLAAAPVRQRNELREAWSVPEIETVNVDLPLRNAHRKGSDLLARFKNQGGYYSNDTKRFEDWTEEVVQLLAGNVPDDDARTFLTTGTHSGNLTNRLQQRLNALQKIIDGLNAAG